MNAFETPDPYRDDIGAWVLGALPEAEAERMSAHLQTCDACAREAAELQIAADHLPLAALQVDPPPELKDRVMAVVRREAELLAAAGASADLPERRPRERRSGVWGWIVARPLAASACAASLVVAGLGAGFAIEGGGDGQVAAPRTIAGGSSRGGSATLVTGAQGTELRVSSMRAPKRGHVYEAWIRRGNGLPTPAGVFTVDHQGDGALALKGSVDHAREVVVTEEPEGGSAIPTSDPFMRVSLS